MPATMDQPNYITTEQAALRAGVHEATIRRWIREGLFAWRMKNRHEREIDEDDFNTFLTDLRSPVSKSTA